MNYKLKDEDKIEVVVGDLRSVVEIAAEFRTRYPAAFVPEEEWEDVTELVIAHGMTRVQVANPKENYSGMPKWKIENNRILRKK